MISSSLEQLSSQAIPWLADLTLKASLIMVVALALCELLRKSEARVRATVLTAAFVGLLALPVLSVLVPAWELDVMPDFSAAAVSSTREFGVTEQRSSSPMRSSAALVDVESPATVNMKAAAWESTSVPSTITASQPASSGISWLTAIWLAGTTLSALWLMTGLITIAQVTRKSIPLGGSWNRLIAGFNLGGDPVRTVSWRQSDQLGSPVTWGLLKPVVLMPASAGDWSDERRELVMMHELVHVQRLDWLMQILARLVCAMHWFNPLVWMAMKRLHIERERACDEAVIASGAAPATYASHLLDVARAQVNARLGTVATLAMARRSQLEGRLISILNCDPRSSANRLLLAATALAMVVLVTVLSALGPASAETIRDESASAENEIEIMLSGLVDQWDASREQVATLTAQQDHIFELKNPYYDQIESIQAETQHLEDAYQQLQSEFEPFESELQALQMGEQQQPSAELRKLLQRENELAELLEPYDLQLEALHAKIEEFVEQWNDIQSKLEPLLTATDELDQAIDDHVVAAIAQIVESSTSHLRLPAAAIEDAAAAVYQHASRVKLDRHLYLAAAHEVVRQDLNRTLSLHSDSTDLPAAIEHAAHRIGVTRFVLTD